MAGAIRSKTVLIPFLLGCFLVGVFVTGQDVITDTSGIQDQHVDIANLRGSGVTAVEVPVIDENEEGANIEGISEMIDEDEAAKVPEEVERAEDETDKEALESSSEEGEDFRSLGFFDSIRDTVRDTVRDIGTVVGAVESVGDYHEGRQGFGSIGDIDWKKARDATGAAARLSGLFL